MHILIVEDEPAIRQGLKLLLENAISVRGGELTEIQQAIGANRL